MGDESLQTATTCLSSLPQFCKEDEAEDGAAGPLLCVELDGEVQNLVRRRRSPTSLTGGGISFGSGVVLFTSSVVTMGLCGPNRQSTSSRPTKGAVLVVVCYMLNSLNNKMPTFILWHAPITG